MCLSILPMEVLLAIGLLRLQQYQSLISSSFDRIFVF
jgi:hypothetical protein